MTLEYAVCPHCGCQCEDSEYCAACGKLFDDDPIVTSKVSFLGFLGRGMRSIISSFELGHKVPEVDASDDPGLAHLPGNSYHSIWRHKNK